ncbi:hypothetical protein C8K30_115107 [Promicromonospora sp. AC04]|uniref:hypothetical protein n=1 Tax=Promicromonospora sp. AC04 TaxID=2135723 RepID=UPI000D340AB6|nr:hypothetical protein [Promicromonospora sp. AC04]PUB20896.1 hypothetical protein C8K30_115107 [Promicromonospora sp. AC04]
MTDHDDIDYEDLVHMLQADALAERDHHRADASGVHAVLAVQIWRALRTLGAGHGRMTVTGVDPHVFARLPRDRVQTWDSENSGILRADIPQEGIRSAPTDDPDTTTDANTFAGERARSDGVVSLFDVVIYNAALSDVTFHRPDRRADLQQDQGVNLLIHLARTVPGGFLAALMSRDVLDDPQSAIREAVAALGDVLGVVRLPDGALRNVAGCDNPTDLLLVRRRLDDEPASDQSAFIHTAAGMTNDPVPEVVEYLNSSFLHPPMGHLLGTIDTRVMPWGNPRFSLQPSGRALSDDLTSALDQVVRSARQRGLMAGPGHRTATEQKPLPLSPHGHDRPEAQGPSIDL